MKPVTQYLTAVFELRPSKRRAQTDLDRGAAMTAAYFVESNLAEAKPARELLR